MNDMKRKCVLVLLSFTIVLLAFRPDVKNQLSFKTSTGHLLKVFKGQIFYDNRVVFKFKYDDIIYESKSHRILEDHGAVFLFIAFEGSPNLDRLNKFLITSATATLVADAVISPIMDYDNDGYLEFGGRDLTEHHLSPDSMYYVPSKYYEIRNGKVLLDNSLTRTEDIKVNGLYLPSNKQVDKHGYCCKVIPKPGKKR
jgi:hypothetical protein